MENESVAPLQSKIYLRYVDIFKRYQYFRRNSLQKALQLPLNVNLSREIDPNKKFIWFRNFCISLLSFFELLWILYRIQNWRHYFSHSIHWKMFLITFLNDFDKSLRLIGYSKFLSVSHKLWNLYLLLRKLPKHDIRLDKIVDISIKNIKMRMELLYEIEQSCG